MLSALALVLFFMKKDPYFPMYFRDFLASTDLMSNEQVGAHIRILCHQADKGHLPESSIRERICGPIWESLMGRYKQDDEGKWYHERMEKTLKERKRYVENRVENLKSSHMGTPHETPICVPHMECNSSSSSKKNIYITPSVEEISQYCKERNNSIDPQRFFDFYSSKGWMIGKNRMKDWRAAVRTWERNNGKKQEVKVAFPHY